MTVGSSFGPQHGRREHRIRKTAQTTCACSFISVVSFACRNLVFTLAVQRRCPPKLWCFPTVAGGVTEGDREKLYGQHCALPKNKGYPERRALEGPQEKKGKKKRRRRRKKNTPKQAAPRPGHSLEVTDYKTKPVSV